MNILSYNKIKIRVITIALTLFVSVFAISGVSAQTISGVPVGGTSDIVISAQVIGCGDAVVQNFLGEQCDGPDLNGQSCSSLGFGSGTLSCRTSCIFETTSCVAGTTSLSDSGGGSRRSDDEIVLSPTTNLFFSGTANPGDIIVVLNNDTYFASGITDQNGVFTIFINQPVSDDYKFTFYGLSAAQGESFPQNFDINIQKNTTTQIKNINLKYPPIAIFDKKIDNEEVGLPEELIDLIEESNPLFDILLVNVVDSEQSPVPYVVFAVLGIAFAGIIRLLIILFRYRRHKYIDHYDITK